MSSVRPPTCGKLEACVKVEDINGFTALLSANPTLAPWAMACSLEKLLYDKSIGSGLWNLSHVLPFIEKAFQAGASLDACYGDRHLVAMELFAEEGAEDQIKWLLNRGANVDGAFGTKVVLFHPEDVKGSHYNTPLREAVRNHAPGIVKFLAQQGAAIETVHPYGYGPLAESINKASLESFLVLLELGVSPSIQQEGNTLLHLVAYSAPEHLNMKRLSPTQVETMTKALLEVGVDWNAKNNYGQTWEDVLMQCSHPETLWRPAFGAVFADKAAQRLQGKTPSVDVNVRPRTSRL